MMKKIEANMVVLKGMVEKFKDPSLCYAVSMEESIADIMEGMLETMELFYKLVTQ